jgi:hypothetical protein
MGLGTFIAYVLASILHPPLSNVHVFCPPRSSPDIVILMRR